MSLKNKGRKSLLLVRAAVIFFSLFPVAYADELETDFIEEDVTTIPTIESKEVTDLTRTIRVGIVSYTSQWTDKGMQIAIFTTKEIQYS